MKVVFVIELALVTLLGSCGIAPQNSEVKQQQWWPKPDQCNMIAAGNCTYQCIKASKPADVIHAVYPHRTSCSVSQCTKANGQSYKKTTLSSPVCNVYVISGAPAGFPSGGGFQ